MTWATMSSMSLCSYQILRDSKSFLQVVSQRCWKISLKRPSYFFRMVFLVVMQRGQFLAMAYLKQACAKDSIELSWLNISRPTPDPGKWCTGMLKAFSPLKSTEMSPGPFTKKSVQLQTSPKACLPITMGLVQFLTSLGTFLIRMGSLKTVPLRQFLMVPLGLFHIFLSLNSSTLASSGVMVAHLMPTLHSLMALADQRVTLSSVLSLCSMPRSKYWILRSKKGWMSSSLMYCQKILVIQSPSSSATGFWTLIFWQAKPQDRQDLLAVAMHFESINKNLIISTNILNYKPAYNICHLILSSVLKYTCSLNTGWEIKGGLQMVQRVGASSIAPWRQSLKWTNKESQEVRVWAISHFCTILSVSIRILNSFQ